MVISLGPVPIWGTRPKAGFSPTMPQWLAGIRIEPAWLPIAMSTSPAATSAALPEDDPLPQVVAVKVH